MRHALVTGASGFIGRELCTRLKARGVRVSALQRHAGAGPWDECRVVDLGADRPAALEGVVTVDGTRRLLAACGAVRRFVYASSVKAMCEWTPAQCVDEDVPARPRSAYGRARREAEELVLAATRMHTAVVRLPLVYGPGVRGNLRTMLRATAAGRMLLLPDFQNRRSMVHVEDACEALIAASVTPAARSRVYLVTDGQCYSTRQIQRLMYAACARRAPGFAVPYWALRLAALAGDGLAALGMAGVPLDSERLSRLEGHACFDCSRARRELGYTPRHALADALPAMFAALDAPAR
jgi:nucleoside-diphosphate-sugar epimerase